MDFRLIFSGNLKLNLEHPSCADRRVTRGTRLKMSCAAFSWMDAIVYLKTPPLQRRISAVFNFEGTPPTLTLLSVRQVREAPTLRFIPVKKESKTTLTFGIFDSAFQTCFFFHGTTLASDPYKYRRCPANWKKRVRLARASLAEHEERP